MKTLGAKLYPGGYSATLYKGFPRGLAFQSARASSRLWNLNPGSSFLQNISQNLIHLSQIESSRGNILNAH